MLETHRRLYNAALAQRKDAWENEARSVGYCEQSARYKAERDTNPYYARLNFSSAQATLRQLKKAFEAFFRRVKKAKNGSGEKPGYPRFKGRDRFNSFTFPAYTDGIVLLDPDHPKLRIQYVGKVRIKLHRPLRGEIKTVCIKREADKWYAIFSCDIGTPKVACVDRAHEPQTGIDLGLERFATHEDGAKIENPRFLKDALPALRRAQRKLARAKKGSNRRRKTKRRVRALHVRVADKRRDFQHKEALKLIRRYGFIAVEDLSIATMDGPRWLNRAIRDAGWGQFLSILKYKAESAGTQVVAVDPAGTSQECSGCGETVPKTLRERKHSCPRCGLVLHRDENAARNILARGLLARAGPEGRNVDVGSHVPRSCFL